MKIKTDFVTNSSSTCFVVMSKGDFTLEKFMVSLGLTEDSPFRDVFEELFVYIKNELIPLHEFISNDKWHKANQSEEDYITSIFSKRTFEKIQDAEKNGYDVYMGRLHSDDGEIISFFCTSSFVIESENLVIDATNDGW
ncbi:MAG: hypothetical protein IKO99_07020 [Bacteroidales bacterium]|nr:hypothetical protein [Bacteroidales bacterium]